MTHSLFHTNASLLIAQSMDARTVTGLLRHSQPNTTLDIYAHAFDKTKRETQEDLGNVMGFYKRICTAMLLPRRQEDGCCYC